MSHRTPDLPPLSGSGANTPAGLMLTPDSTVVGSNASSGAAPAASGYDQNAQKQQQQQKQLDKEALRRFYMSPGKNFTAFQGTKAAASRGGSGGGGGRLPSTVDTPAMGGGNRANTPSVSADASPMNLSSISREGANTPGVGLGGIRNLGSNGSGGGGSKTPQPSSSANAVTSNIPQHVVSSVSQQNTANQYRAGGRNNNTNKNNGTSEKQQTQQQQQQGNGAASPEYLAFLRQQQDLLNIRGKVERVLNELRGICGDQEKYLDGLREEGDAMLRSIEQGGSWSLRSKYDVRQLSKDCGLTLLQQELLKDEPADVAHMNALYERLDQLVSGGADGDTQVGARGDGDGANATEGGGSSKDVSNASTLHLFVENAVRRLGVLVDSLRTGNANTTHVAKAAEPVVMLLHSLCTQPTVEAVVTPYAKAIEQCVFGLEKARENREQSYQDGEIQSAEGLSYDIVEAYEAMLEQLLVKIDALEKCSDEVRAMTAHREQVAKGTETEMEQLHNQTEKMRKRCDDDLKKTFAMCEKVEQTEMQIAQRMKSELERSDEFLQENGHKLHDAFRRLQETYDEIENLERDRHRELQKRLTEKDKEEHRRAEYAQFKQTADEHIVPLERTLTNMGLIKFAADNLRQLSRGAFSQIDDSLRQRESILNLATTEAHKQHVEAFRGYLIELGDIVAKKERMIEEVEDNIQQAIAQKEILTETFNPAAKKFGDIKRKLLQSRDELEQDVEALKQRAGDALKRFERTEEALNRGGIAFVHPVVEQEHHAMEVRAKLMQYKAMAIGHVEGNRLMDDITDFRHRLDETKQEVGQANSLVVGTIGRTIPLVRAAQQQQHQKMLLQSGAQQ